MDIVPFTAACAAPALHIARQLYDREREFVKELPPVMSTDLFPDLAGMAKNGLGVAAYNGDEMVGYWCVLDPFANAFRSTDAVGVFSPMGANGAIGPAREETYAKMYQAGAQKWAQAGASSHAVCLYAHDAPIQRLLFYNGFGMRCMDAIRPVDTPPPTACPGYRLQELTGNDRLAVQPLSHLLDEHMAASPTFLRRPAESAAAFAARVLPSSVRYFAAFVHQATAPQKQEQIAAFLGLEAGSGETFLTNLPHTQHICGAYCLPGHRGKGLYQSLLYYTLRKLRQEGYTHLGVDYESINPTALHFWPKHFGVYTHSLVRRIDEHSLV